MKRLFTLVLLAITIVAKSQAPQLIPYQAIARDATGNAVTNQNIGFRFSIHDQTITGSVIWQEAQTVISNSLGVVVTNLGSASDLSTVNWAQGDKFLQVEMDIAGGTNYSDAGTQQMMSVPFALHAQTATTTFADNGVSRVSYSGDTLFLANGESFIIPGISYANIQGDAHSCGADNIHNSDKTYNTILDHEGNSYKTIIIGDQEWMAENLAVSTYRNGEPIATNLADSNWNTTTEGAWAYLFDDPSKNCPLGKLYNWYTVSDQRGVCPASWHIPSIEEWNSMIAYLGDNAAFKVTTPGGTYWDTGCEVGTNSNANNSSGFSALAGGFKWDTGDYSLGICASAYFQTITYNNNQNYTVALEAGIADFFGIFLVDHNIGQSVRCIKD